MSVCSPPEGLVLQNAGRGVRSLALEEKVVVSHRVDVGS